MEFIDESLNNMNKYCNDKNKYPNEVSYNEGTYTLIIRRNEMGVNCGYIVLPQFHRYDGFEYDDIPVNVHGGLSYSKRENGNWVIGFDTCHVGDYVPYHNYDQNDYYWTHLDVLNELKHLMHQL
jgi:hypothetical protein